MPVAAGAQGGEGAGGWAGAGRDGAGRGGSGGRAGRVWRRGRPPGRLKGSGRHSGIAPPVKNAAASAGRSAASSHRRAAGGGRQRPQADRPARSLQGKLGGCLLTCQYGAAVREALQHARCSARHILQVSMEPSKAGRGGGEQAGGRAGGGRAGGERARGGGHTALLGGGGETRRCSGVQPFRPLAPRRWPLHPRRAAPFTTVAGPAPPLLQRSPPSAPRPAAPRLPLTCRRKTRGWWSGRRPQAAARARRPPRAAAPTRRSQGRRRTGTAAGRTASARRGG
jgi:hypothetical protein